MTDEICKQILKRGVRQICYETGFIITQAEPANILTDVMQRFIKGMGRLCNKYTLLDGQTEGNLDHLALAFNELGMSTSDLVEFAKSKDSSSVDDVPADPLPTESHLHMLKPGCEESVTGTIDDSAEAKPAVFKRPGDPVSDIVAKRSRPTMDDDNRTLREISSVMMNTSEGKLPEARTIPIPVELEVKPEKKRKSKSEAKENNARSKDDKPKVKKLATSGKKSSKLKALKSGAVKVLAGSTHSEKRKNKQMDLDSMHDAKRTSMDATIEAVIQKSRTSSESLRDHDSANEGSYLSMYPFAYFDLFDEPSITSRVRPKTPDLPKISEPKKNDKEKYSSSPKSSKYHEDISKPKNPDVDMNADDSLPSSSALFDYPPGPGLLPFSYPTNPPKTPDIDMNADDSLPLSFPVYCNYPPGPGLIPFSQPSNQNNPLVGGLCAKIPPTPPLVNTLSKQDLPSLPPSPSIYGSTPASVTITPSSEKSKLKKEKKEKKRDKIKDTKEKKKEKKKGNDSEKIWICPACSRPDDGSPMIACDSYCDMWFHWTCVGIEEAPEGDWYCKKCSTKHQRQNKELSKKYK